MVYLHAFALSRIARLRNGGRAERMNVCVGIIDTVTGEKGSFVKINVIAVCLFFICCRKYLSSTVKDPLLVKCELHFQ